MEAQILFKGRHRRNTSRLWWLLVCYLPRLYNGLTTKLPKQNYNSFETQLLEYEKGYDRLTSRLACQIQLEDKHNGLEVRLRDNELL